MNQFTYYQTMYALRRYENRIHSAAEFGGDSEAADVAGRLFDRWHTFDRIAENAGYNDESRNEEANEAYAVYEEFLQMAREADRIYREAVRVLAPVPVRRVVAIGNKHGFTAVLPEMVR